MESFVSGHSRFKTQDYPRHSSLYQRLAREGQSPKALVISCSDSRVVPEIITQSGPGDMFVCRNAGNIVPPYKDGAADAVTSAVEYAVVGLKVSDIVVCGHSDCGAMKALLNPAAVKEMPAVAAWLGHCRCAHRVFSEVSDAAHGGAAAARTLAMENVAAQITHLRTHPCVAAKLATGALRLHGWFFDVADGRLYAMDGQTKLFSPIEDAGTLPIAVAGDRTSVAQADLRVAAE